ncbi:MAG: SDR family oxidoreductase [Spirochaetales bacterium]|nr:SDR family oxidoreductase [Spirochaetales bacterium]
MRQTPRSVVLVSGASSGIGNACATYLSKKGHAVYGTSRDPGARARRADEFFELLTVEVRDDESVRSAVDEVLSREKRLDVLVCSAGIGVAGAVEETALEDGLRQIDVNFMGVVRMVRAALPWMRVHGGSIFVLGSLAGRYGVPFQAYYSASKRALQGFVESLRMELVGFPVRVALIEPVHIRTGFYAARMVCGLAEDSPYAANGRRAIRSMEESEQLGSDPVLVARKISRLVRARHLRARYSVGPWLVRFGLALRQLLPYCILERLIMAHYSIDARNGDR